jgi:hypothetical protein
VISGIDFSKCTDFHAQPIIPLHLRKKDTLADAARACVRGISALQGSIRVEKRYGSADRSASKNGIVGAYLTL